MIEGAYGAVSDGGLFERPWEIPKLGGSVGGSGRGIGQSAGRTGIGTAQGLGSTGVGGTFAQGTWPGKMSPAWKHRGLLGGEGIRTGGYA